MDNRVTFRAAKAVQDAGLAALRFNFRGVGASSGSYDEGAGEKDDVASAIDWLQRRYTALPLTLVGFSFGAWVGLAVGCPDPHIRACVGLGLPLNFYDFDFLMENEKPALYIVGTQDEFCPMDKLDFFERRLPESSSVRRIEHAGHFFDSQLDQVQDLIVEFLNSVDLGRV